MMREIAADWHAALKKYPAWAIQNACRWWVGEDNDKCHSKPVPGDIAARAKSELGIVKLAEGVARRSLPQAEAAQPTAEPAAERCSPEAARAIMEQAGFGVRRFDE